jgi:hypothetical protein
LESGSAGDGTTVSVMVSGDNNAEERRAVAAVAALEPRTIRVGTAMVQSREVNLAREEFGGKKFSSQGTS